MYSASVSPQTPVRFFFKGFLTVSTNTLEGKPEALHHGVTVTAKPPILSRNRLSDHLRSNRKKTLTSETVQLTHGRRWPPGVKPVAYGNPRGAAAQGFGVGVEATQRC